MTRVLGIAALLRISAFANDRSSPPRLLLLATQRWPTAARLGLAMRSVGFRVSLWSPARHPLLLTDALASHHACELLRPLASLTAALLDTEPELIVPCDDLAAFRLRQLTERAATEPSLHPLLASIERSVGRASGLARLASRAQVLDIAAAAGIHVPMNRGIQSIAELGAWFDRHGFPAYLKADGTSGGIGVRPVRNYEEASAAFRLLDAPPHALRAFKRLAIDGDSTLLDPLVHRRHPAISVQQAVSGSDANSAIFCWQGKVLASISVQVVATCYERGPSTVVRRIANSAMDRAGRLLAARLHLSGFYGLDFILDAQNGRPWLLEMNSRATQVAHLALGPGRDLATAAYSAVTGASACARPCLTDAECIALFPQEWHRDPHSPLLHRAFHDVPWEAPRLVTAYVTQRPGWRGMLTHQYWRSRHAHRSAQERHAAWEEIVQLTNANRAG